MDCHIDYPFRNSINSLHILLHTPITKTSQMTNNYLIQGLEDLIDIGKGSVWVSGRTIVEIATEALQKNNTNMKSGIELIAEERQEQIEKHGFSVEDDAEYYQKNELIKAALFCIDNSVFEWPFYWQEKFRDKILNKRDQIERLKIAGALIAAEIDRLQNKPNDRE